VVLFVRHLCFPVNLHFHISVTSVLAWIQIQQILNETIKYCCNSVLFPLIVAGKKSLFCTSQSLWWVVCSCSVSWIFSVDVSIVAFLTLHATSPFWQIEIFANPFFKGDLILVQPDVMVSYIQLYRLLSTRQTLRVTFAEGITQNQTVFSKQKSRPFRVVIEEFCMKLTQGRTGDAFSASSELLFS